MGHLRGFRKTADNAGQPAWRPVHRSQNRLAQVRPAIAVSAVDDEQAHTGNLGKTRRHDGGCEPGVSTRIRRYSKAGLFGRGHDAFTKRTALPPPTRPGGHRPWCRHTWADTSRIRAAGWASLKAFGRSQLSAVSVDSLSLRPAEQSANQEKTRSADHCRYLANQVNEARNVPVAQPDRALPSEGRWPSNSGSQGD